MVLRFLKEPARIVLWGFFEAFSRGFISLELEMISFLSLIFELFFRGVGFAEHLRMFLIFFFHF